MPKARTCSQLYCHVFGVRAFVENCRARSLHRILRIATDKTRRLNKSTDCLLLAHSLSDQFVEKCRAAPPASGISVERTKDKRPSAVNDRRSTGCIPFGRTIAGRSCSGDDMRKTMKKFAMQSRPVASCEHTIASYFGRQYRHSWTAQPGGGLDSTCMKCSTVVATDMDELSLLVAEQAHVCQLSQRNC